VRLLWARMQMEQWTGGVFDASEWKCAACTLPEMTTTSVQSIATHLAGGEIRRGWRASFTADDNCTAGCVQEVGFRRLGRPGTLVT